MTLSYGSDIIMGLFRNGKKIKCSKCGTKNSLKEMREIHRFRLFCLSCGEYLGKPHLDDERDGLKALDVAFSHLIDKKSWEVAPSKTMLHTALMKRFIIQSDEEQELARVVVEKYHQNFEGMPTR